MVNAAQIESPKSVNRRIFTATLTVGAFTALAKLAGGAKVIVMARYFGTSDALDAFLIAFVLPSFVADTAAVALIASLLPTFIETRQRYGMAAAQRLYGSALAGGVFFLSALAIAFALSANWVLPLIGSGFTGPKLALTRSLFYCLLLWLPISGFIVAWRAVLNAGEQFALPAAAPIATPLITIALLVIPGMLSGAWALALGTVFGVLCEALLLGFAIRAGGYSVAPRWGGWSPELRTVLNQYLPVAAASVIVGGASLIDQGMAARLGAGSVSALVYGGKLVTVMLAVASASLGTAMLPHFSQMIVSRDRRGLRHTVLTYAGVVVVISIVTICAAWWLSQPIVRIAFQRGAFSGAQTQLVATIQRYSLLQIPFAVLLGMGVRLASSLKANRLMLETAVLSVSVNIFADVFLMRWLGIPGIALADSVVYAVALSYLSWMLIRRVRNEVL